MKKLLFYLLLLFTLSCNQTLTYSEIEVDLSKKDVKPNQLIEMDKGDIVKFEGTVEFSDGTSTKDVTWESLNPDIVSVDPDGKVTAVAEGNAKLKIIAKQDNTKSSQIDIKVSPRVVIREGVNVGTTGKLAPGELEAFTKPSGPVSSTVPGSIPGGPLTNIPGGPLASPGSAFPPLPGNGPVTNPVPTTAPDIKYLPLNVQVFDIFGNLVDNAVVTVKSLDKRVNWTSQPEKTVNGFISLKAVPASTLLMITATKTGWTQQSRTEVLKGGDIPTINFGGSGDGKNYAIRNEPQISDITFNKIKISGPGLQIADFNPEIPPAATANTNISFTKTVAVTDISISINFSEAVDKESVESNFQIISQKLGTTNDFYLMTKETDSCTFTWSANNTSVTIQTTLKYDNSLSKMVYRLQFKNGFRDLEGNDTVTEGQISFPNNISTDYIVFIMKK
jgi:hypothetical protein